MAPNFVPKLLVSTTLADFRWPRAQYQPHLTIRAAHSSPQYQLLQWWLTNEVCCERCSVTVASACYCSHCPTLMTPPPFWGLIFTILIAQQQPPPHNIHTLMFFSHSLCPATNLCFQERSVYTQEVLAVVLQQLLEQTPIPMLFMRTVSFSFTTHTVLSLLWWYRCCKVWGYVQNW